jgi:hypothetical protein
MEEVPMISAVIASLVLVFGVADGAADFYVAPDGNDNNAGTLEAPFATLVRAQDAVRERIRGGLDQDLTVLIRGGEYVLDAPLAFGPEDSGSESARITYAAYPGETVTITGGRGISGWKAAEGDRWTVELPEVAAGTWYFRQLFADGARLPRGRFPNGDELLRVETVNPEVTEIVLNEAPPVADLAGKDAELVMYQNWSISRGRIASSDGKTLRMANPVGWIGHGDATTASPNKPTYIENAIEFVDAPGEWHLDRKTGVLTYQAKPGEDPNQARFVAPRLEQLLVVAGRPDAPVTNLRFQGLAFAYTEWPLPSFGYLGIQAGHHGTRMDEATHVLPLAMSFAYARGCGLEKCAIAHTGACGVGFGAGCRNNLVKGCALDDIGGNGIMVGWRGDRQSGRIDFAGDASLSADWKDPEDVPRNNEIADNTIERCGAVNHGCVGIFDAFCAGTHIHHNLVTDMPYTGISTGFRWDESSTSQRDGVIEYNHIHDVMKKLADGGGIYTLGLQPGMVLRGNLIYDVHRSGYAHGGAPNNGIFFDQGSKGYLVEGNIIYGASGDPIRFNQTGKDNLNWKDNHFGVAPGDAGFPEDAAKLAGPK